MKLIRQKAKLAGIFLTILMLYITVPFDSVLAAMIGTEATLDLARAQQARDEINKLLSREDVQNALKAQGVSPLEAKARIDSLSDAEVIRLADQLNKLPAGGGQYGKPSGAVIVVAILLVVGIFVLIVFGIYKAVTYEKSDSAEEYPKSIGGSEYNPEEPWTGVWKVEGNINISGIWSLKQSDKIVNSTKDSAWKLMGNVEGSQLKGQVIGDYGEYYKTVIEISSDGQSFKGSATPAVGARGGLVTGSREQSK